MYMFKESATEPTEEGTWIRGQVIAFITSGWKFCNVKVEIFIYLDLAFPLLGIKSMSTSEKKMMSN